MKIAILVKEGPYTHQASDSALQFARAVMRKGHSVARVFFYNDGVYNANQLIEPQSDERHLSKLWSDLAVSHGVDLVVCVAAANRRGIDARILQKGFRIAGLGQLVEAGIENDRVVVFGD